MTHEEAIKSILERCPHKLASGDGKMESIFAVVRWMKRHATAEERNVLALSDEPPFGPSFHEKDQKEVADRLWEKVKDDLQD